MNNFTWSREHERAGALKWCRASEVGNLVLPRPLVFLNGCFDLLHASHMRLIFNAASHGKTVVVAMDSDKRVKELKGASRPILSWVERATALSYLPVNYLIEFGSEEELKEIVLSLQPDLRVCGGDKLDNPGYFPMPNIKTLLVPSRGLSTSLIIERCRR